MIIRGVRMRFDFNFLLKYVSLIHHNILNTHLFYFFKKLKYLLRDVLDKHSSTIQTANLQRAHQYDDELQHLDKRSSPDAPSWSCIAQEDTESNFYYNYNTKDRTGEEEAKGAGEEEEVESRTDEKADEVFEDEKAKDGEVEDVEYDSILEMDD